MQTNEHLGWLTAPLTVSSSKDEFEPKGLFLQSILYVLTISECVCPSTIQKHVCLGQLKIKVSDVQRIRSSVCNAFTFSLSVLSMLLSKATYTGEKTFPLLSLEIHSVWHYIWCNLFFYYLSCFYYCNSETLHIISFENPSIFIHLWKIQISLSTPGQRVSLNQI